MNKLKKVQRKQIGKLKYSGNVHKGGLWGVKLLSMYTDLSDTASERGWGNGLKHAYARGQRTASSNKAETCYIADPGKTVQLEPGQDKWHKINSRVFECCVTAFGINC